MGYKALTAVTTGYHNLGFGPAAGFEITSGSRNVCIGIESCYNAGVPLETVTDSIFIGHNAICSVDGLDNVIVIGLGVSATISNQVILGNAAVVETLLKGRVGIRTNSPATAGLQIDSNTTFSLTDLNDNILLGTDDNVGDDNYGGSIGFTHLIGTEASRRAAIAAVQTDADSDRVGLAFFTHPTTASNDTIVEAARIEHDGKFAIGLTTGIAGKLHIDQSVDSAAIPVLALDQADLSEGFIDYLGTSAASAVGPITSWTTGNTIQGFVRVEINGAAFWMPYYDSPTS